MTARAPRFEVVRSDAGWFARFRAANGRIVWVTESLTRRSAAKKAIASIAQAFALTPVGWSYMGEELRIYAQGVGAEVREIDEREVTR